MCVLVANQFQAGEGRLWTRIERMERQKQSVISFAAMSRIGYYNKSNGHKELKKLRSVNNVGSTPNVILVQTSDTSVSMLFLISFKQSVVHRIRITCASVGRACLVSLSAH